MAISEINSIPYPFIIMAKSASPTKEHEDEWNKKIRQMAYLHRSIIPVYADCIGETEDKAKVELQIKFARTGEVMVDDSGAYDVTWVELDKTRIFEHGKMYYVHSVADMSNKEISDFIEQCKRYIYTQYGVHIGEFISNYKTKQIKK